MAQAYSNIDRQTLDVIKYPPVIPPEVSYFSDTTYNYNNLRGQQWQFAYRYVYDDNEKSVLSPYSKVRVPQYEELANGDFVQEITTNNQIDIRLRTGHHTCVRIEVFVRRGNIGKWQLFKSIENFSEQLHISWIASNGSNILTNVDVLTLGKTISDIKEGMRLGETSSYFIVDVDENNNTVTLNKPYTEDISTSRVTDSEEVVVSFRNDTTTVMLDQDRLLQPYDNVPQLARHQELIKDNRIVYGDVTMGYPPVDIDVDIDFSLDYLPSINLSSGELETNSFAVVIDAENEEGALRILNFGLNDFLSNTLYVFNFNTSDNERSYTLKYFTGEQTSDEIDSGLTNMFQDMVDKEPEFTELTGDPYARYRINTLFSRDNTDPTISASYYNENGSKKYSHFKFGSWQNFGIVYYDRAMRRNAIGKNSFKRVYVPYYSDFTPQEYQSEPGYTAVTTSGCIHLPSKIRSLSRWKVKHRPPSWAKYWGWVVGESDIILKGQYLIKSIDNDNPDIYNDNGYGNIKINRNVDSLLDVFKNSITSKYVWNKGDRLRFVSYIYEDEFYNFREYIDHEIIGVEYPDTSESYLKDDNGDYVTDENGNKLKNDAELIIKIPTFNKPKCVRSSSDYYIVEIYRKRNDLDPELATPVWREIGDIFEIGNFGESGRYHKTIIAQTDQDPNNPAASPAKGVFDYGDTYLRVKNFIDKLAFIESTDMSEFYLSDSTDVGRPVEQNDDSNTIRRYDAGIYGGRYLEGSNINNMSEFGLSSYFELQNKHGNITGLREVGNILYAIQTSKVTAMYVGLVEVEEQGKKSLALTSDVIGSQRPMVDDYGTRHSGSIVSNNRYLYFFDDIKGCHVRVAPNGAFPISNYGMSSFFKEVSMITRRLDTQFVQVTSEYDENHDELLLTISYSKDNVDYDYTISFFDSEYNDQKGYKSFYSFIPEKIHRYGNVLLSFKDGNIWLHDHLKDGNDEPVYNRFYGTDYNSVIQVVCNIDNKKDKEFKGLAVYSNSKWTAPSKGDLRIDATERFPDGLDSLIPSSYMEARKSMYHAPVLRDMNDPDQVTETGALINGRFMIGQALKIKLTNSSSSKVVLNGIIVYLSPSEYSK